MSNTVTGSSVSGTGNFYWAGGTTPSNTLFDTLERRIPEIINNVLTNMLPGIDPAFNVLATSEGVESSSIGRDLIVRKLFQGALTGVVEMDTPTTYPTLFGGTTVPISDTSSGASSTLFATSAGTFFPDVSKQVEPKPVEMAIPLQAIKGNLKMTLGEIKLDALQNVIGDVVAPKLVGFAAQLARYRAIMFYTNDNTDYSLCNMTNIEVGTGVDAGRVVFTPSNDATGRFVRGMQVDLFHQSGGSGTYDTKLNVVLDADVATEAKWQVYSTPTSTDVTTGTSTSIPVYVEAVDYMSDRVTLVLKYGPWIDGALADNKARKLPSGATPARTIKVCLAGTKYLGANGEAFSGLNTWIKSTGSIYGVSLATFPEFKSLKYTESGPLTEQKLRRICSRYNIGATQTHGFTIDGFITTQGVLDAYAATKIGEQQIQRQGTTLDLDHEGGVTSATFMHDGRRYKLEPSAWCDYGTLYGINKGGMKRYVPTRPAGMGNLPNAPSYLEFNFVAPLLTGNSSIRMPTPSGTTGQWTDTIQMPGESRMEVVPSQFPMIKVDGLSEDKLVGDYATDMLA